VNSYLDEQERGALEAHRLRLRRRREVYDLLVRLPSTMHKIRSTINQVVVVVLSLKTPSTDPTH